MEKMQTTGNTDQIMPVLFVGHGNPLNAVEDNAFSRAWADMGRTLPTPAAILCISAHWQTPDLRVTAMDRPRTIHDFYGFPRPLYEIRYPCPGAPEMAGALRRLVPTEEVQNDSEWGLDHGAWAVLRHMFPRADIPVAQLSLDRTRTPERHYALGKQLKALRHRGVLIVGSGNVVHNLGAATWEDRAYDWALRFDERVKQAIVANDHRALVAYDTLGPEAGRAIPTSEHYLPLLYALALKDDQDPIAFFAEAVTMGSISMRCVRIG